MLSGLLLFFVGAVLCLNGLWLLGRVQDREIWVINLFAAAVSFCVALRLALGAGADLTSVKEATMALLFSLNYFWIALNRANGADGRGLGWFSLFVAVTAAAVSGETLRHAATLWDFWNGLSWAAWAVLWALFFVLLVLRRDIGRATGIVAIALGISTGWLPGYLLLSGLL